MRPEGPGLLLRDLLRGTPRTEGIARVIAAARANIVILAGLDFDAEHRTLHALADRIAGANGPAYAHIAAPRSNSGLPTGLDLNENGRTGEPADAQGYGRYEGQSSLAILSQWPLRGITDHNALLWSDLPGSLFIDAAGRTGPEATAHGLQRLSSTTHAEAIVDTGDAALTLLIFQAAPPVFDGPEDRNGRRNHDEIAFWRHRLAGLFGPPPDPPFVIAGVANLDPEHGEGRKDAIRDLLAHSAVQDPPDLAGPTADFGTPGAGRLRTDYLLPSAGLTLRSAKLSEIDPALSRHAPLLLELAWPP
ncbi:endonuclease/exonuclease/phosphatase family protein [Pseudooceanicola sp. C21-150M6]